MNKTENETLENQILTFFVRSAIEQAELLEGVNEDRKQIHYRRGQRVRDSVSHLLKLDGHCPYFGEERILTQVRKELGEEKYQLYFGNN